MKRSKLEKYARLIIALDRFILPLARIVTLLTPKYSYHTNSRLFVKISEQGAIALCAPIINETLKLNCDDDFYFVTLDINKDALLFVSELSKNNIFLLRTDSVLAFLASFFNFLLWARRKKIETVINLDIFSNISDILVTATRAEKKYQIGKVESRNHVKYEPTKHIYNHYEELLIKSSLIHAKVVADYPQIVKEIKDNSIALYVNVEDPLALRSWPVANWIELIKKLENSNYKLKILAPEKNIPETLLSYFKKYYIETKTMADLLSEIEKSNFLVTTDCGTSHFCAYTSTPSLTLFGPESLDFFGSLSSKNVNLSSLSSCSPCFNQYNKCLSSCSDNICMKLISSSLVFDHVSSFLELSNASA